MSRLGSTSAIFKIPRGVAWPWLDSLHLQRESKEVVDALPSLWISSLTIIPDYCSSVSSIYFLFSYATTHHYYSSLLKYCQAHAAIAPGKQ
jgi:hypothetical protein